MCVRSSVSRWQVVFMHGGLYTLCYTPDGTFDELDNKMEYNTLLNVTIEVIGAFLFCSVIT